MMHLLLANAGHASVETRDELNRTLKHPPSLGNDIERVVESLELKKRSKSDSNPCIELDFKHPLGSFAIYPPPAK
jgi:hypothetical protein